MISVCAYLYDTAGILFSERFQQDSSDVFVGSRRVSRTATLDGGVLITDFGYTDGDRTFTVHLSPFSLSQLETVERIFKLHSLVTISLRDGAYLAAPQDYSSRGDTLRTTWLIKQRISS